MILPNAFNSSCPIDVYSLVHFSFCNHVDNKSSFLLKNKKTREITNLLIPLCLNLFLVVTNWDVWDSYNYNQCAKFQSNRSKSYVAPISLKLPFSVDFGPYNQRVTRWEAALNHRLRLPYTCIVCDLWMINVVGRCTVYMISIVTNFSLGILPISEKLNTSYPINLNISWTNRL